MAKLEIFQSNGRTHAIVTGVSLDDVQNKIWDLSEDYAAMMFTLPARTATGEWVAKGVLDAKFGDTEVPKDTAGGKEAGLGEKSS